MTKKILFFITQAEYGGAQRFLHTLITNLRSEDYQCEVAIGHDGASDFLKAEFTSRGIPVHTIDSLGRNPSPIRDFKAARAFRKLVKEREPDTVFLLSTKAGFVGSLATVFPSRIVPLRVIYRIGGWTFNDPWPEWKRWLWIALEWLSSRWKDVIVVNNSHDLIQAHRLNISPRDHITMIHNGIDAYKLELLPREEARVQLYAEAPREQRALLTRKYYIGTIANFYPSKGLIYLLATASQFQHRDDVVFIIIGDGPERKNLEQAIRSYKITNVVLMGQLPDASRFLRAFDVFALASVKEGSPWTLLEAMAARVPIVSTRVGAVPEIIDNKKNGLLVPIENSAALTTAIHQLLKDDHARQEMGIQGHQTVLFRFSLSTMIDAVKVLL